MPTQHELEARLVLLRQARARMRARMRGRGRPGFADAQALAGSWRKIRQRRAKNRVRRALHQKLRRRV